MMKKLCIKDVVIDNLIFVRGLDYEIEFNPFCNKLIIYNSFGYTTIEKEELDKNFL